jgi:hypothetical protein
MDPEDPYDIVSWLEDEADLWSLDDPIIGNSSPIGRNLLHAAEMIEDLCDDLEHYKSAADEVSSLRENFESLSRLATRFSGGRRIHHPNSDERITLIAEAILSGVRRLELVNTALLDVALLGKRHLNAISDEQKDETKCRLEHAYNRLSEVSRTDASLQAWHSSNENAPDEPSA